MSENPNPPCPECQSEYAYEDGSMFTCPDCGHEWQPGTIPESSAGATEGGFCDAHGNPLVDGDTISVIKDLKIKGTSSVVKVGTKVKNIRLIDGDHDIDCKIPGIGPMKLKSEFVKKA